MTINHACMTCQDRIDSDDIQRSVSGISPEVGCEVCGRSYYFDKMRVWYTIMNESGNEEEMTETVDWEGDTPLEAINSILQKYNGPRGARVTEISKITFNKTPLLSEDEIGERTVVYEETGVLVHNIELNVSK